jgi:thiol-disulfide isomerase/thioredoxin
MNLRPWLPLPARLSPWLLAAPLALGCPGGGPKGSGAKDGGIGSAAPTVQGKTLEGEYLALSDYRGKVVLLNVWATWCAPCRKELPELVALHDRYGKDGFVVLGVSVDQPGARGQVERLVKQFGLDYPIVLDPGGVGLDALSIRGYPTSFLIGRDGTLRWRRDGLVEPGEGELAGQIKAALAES